MAKRELQVGMPVKVKKDTSYLSGKRGVIIQIDDDRVAYPVIVQLDGEAHPAGFEREELKFRKGVPWEDEEGHQHDGEGNVIIDFDIEDDALLKVAKIAMERDLTINETLKQLVLEVAKAEEAQHASAPLTGQGGTFAETPPSLL